MGVPRTSQHLVYALAALAVIGVWRVRRAIRPLLGMIAAFGAMALGLFAVIGYQGARAMATTQFPFPQARYLFPLLALYALAIVLVTKAAPRRWGPVLGALLVALALAHNLFAETLTISRYYGSTRTDGGAASRSHGLRIADSDRGARAVAHDRELGGLDQLCGDEPRHVERRVQNRRMVLEQDHIDLSGAQDRGDRHRLRRCVDRQRGGPARRVDDEGARPDRRGAERSCDAAPVIALVGDARLDADERDDADRAEPSDKLRAQRGGERTAAAPATTRSGMSAARTLRVIR